MQWFSLNVLAQVSAKGIALRMKAWRVMQEYFMKEGQSISIQCKSWLHDTRYIKRCKYISLTFKLASLFRFCNSKYTLSYSITRHDTTHRSFSLVLLFPHVEAYPRPQTFLFLVWVTLPGAWTITSAKLCHTLHLVLTDVLPTSINSESLVVVRLWHVRACTLPPVYCNDQQNGDRQRQRQGQGHHERRE